MKLFLIGNDYKYQVESLLKMFFPTARFPESQTLEEGEDFVLARKKEGRHAFSLLVLFRLDGKRVRRHGSVPLDTPPEQVRERLCRELYLGLCQLLDTRLPWGMLTGVRPVKRVRRMRHQEGKTPDQVREELEERFLVSREKIDLCLATAAVQDELEMELREEVCSLYISIPFCPTRCSYCSFVSQAIGSSRALGLMEEYVGCLCQELEAMGQIVQQTGLRLETVYFGGGTPTSLDAHQLERLLTTVETHFDLKNLTEYTVEAGRVDTITREKLETLRRHPVTRISINPQSFNDQVLRGIGRRHTGQEVIDCYRMARELGFSQINMDLIAGLPLDTPERFRHSVDTALSLGPENITIHALTLKRSSDFYQNHREEFHPGGAAEMVSYGARVLQEAGYRPYYLYRQKNMVDNLENVGYAKPGTESPYNITIMEENQTVLAAGAGAVTKLVDKNGLTRIFNYKYPYEYNAGIQEMITRKQSVVEFYASRRNQHTSSE